MGIELRPLTTEIIHAEVIVGIILGIVLTVVAAFVYDAGTGRAANGLGPTAAAGAPPLVNWDVVNDNWRGVKAQLEKTGAEVEKGWKRITG